jgi:hypothetical protein
VEGLRHLTSLKQLHILCVQDGLRDGEECDPAVPFIALVNKVESTRQSVLGMPGTLRQGSTGGEESLIH